MPRRDLDSSGERGIEQRFEQRAPMNPQPPACTAAQAAIPHIQHDAVRRTHAPEEFLQRGAQRAQAISGADLIKHSKANRLQDQPRPDRLRRPILS